MNHLLPLEKLGNSYFAMRHGESEANAQKKIVSDPADGTNGYGLIREGREQVRQAAETLLKLSNVVIYSSDFARARETAEIVAEVLKVDSIHFAEELRERFFGDLDGRGRRDYLRVWKDDLLNPDNKKHNVESINEVCDRATRLVVGLEVQYTNKAILLVSHADVLDILQLAFEKKNLQHHSQIQQIKPAEIRELLLG